MDTEASNCASRAPYVLLVTDDSMEPEFKENAVIIVDPDYPHTHKAYVVVDYNDDTYFRQFQMREGKMYLTALNSNYPEIPVEKEYTVRGVVTQQARNRKNGVKKAIHYI